MEERMHGEIEQRLIKQIHTIQNSENKQDVADAIEEVLLQFAILRENIRKRYYTKRVDLDDLGQVVDLRIIEALYDYDESKDSAPIRHIVCRAKNGAWNFYKKENHGFREDRKFCDIDAVSDEHLIDKSISFDEVIDKLTVSEEIKKLGEKEKEALLMYYLLDLSQEDVAKELNIHQAHVSRLTRKSISKIKSNVTF